jgi:hypothetical protein
MITTQSAAFTAAIRSATERRSPWSSRMTGM